METTSFHPVKWFVSLFEKNQDPPVATTTVQTTASGTTGTGGSTPSLADYANLYGQWSTVHHNEALYQKLVTSPSWITPSLYYGSLQDHYNAQQTNPMGDYQQQYQQFSKLFADSLSKEYLSQLVCNGQKATFEAETIPEFDPPTASQVCRFTFHYDG